MKRLCLAYTTLSTLSLIIVPVRMEAQVEWISTTNSKPWFKQRTYKRTGGKGRNHTISHATGIS